MIAMFEHIDHAVLFGPTSSIQSIEGYRFLRQSRSYKKHDRLEIKMSKPSHRRRPLPSLNNHLDFRHSPFDDSDIKTLVHRLSAGPEPALNR